MLAAIYGDLAACTFKRNRALFEKQLVGENAFLSDKGLLALATADALVIRDAETLPLFKAVIKEYHDDRDKNKVHFPKWFEQWCSAADKDYAYDSDFGVSLPMCCVTAAWDFVLSVKLHNHLLNGKAAGYAAYYFSHIISYLKEGHGKDKTLNMPEIGMLPNWVENAFFSEEPYNALHSLILAWKAFYSSYDFTSAVKRAAALSAHSDTRVVTMMAASMAEVFYHVDVKNLVFPSSVVNKYADVLKKLIEFETDSAKRDRILAELLATHSF